MELGKTQQYADQLYFSLYQRPLHPELFRIHRVKRVEHRFYNAEIWIVGLGHVVTVQFGNRYLTELVAEQNDLLPKAGLANNFRFRGERDYSQTFDSGLQYLLSTQVERMSANLFPPTHRDLLRYGRRRGVSFEFEEWESEEGLVPFSFVDFEAREREFLIHAYHVFPVDQTILKTQSIFEISATGSLLS